jgi:hypothetical protein
MTESNQPTVVLDFGDGQPATFKAERYANQFLLVRHLDQAYGSDGDYYAIVAVTNLVRDQVLDEERDRLDEFLLAHGRSDDYVPVIRDALGECWKGETNLPLGSSQDSSETTSQTDGATSSTGGLSSADILAVDLEPVAVLPEYAD